jgi:hypothetical protein
MSNTHTHTSTTNLRRAPRSHPRHRRQLPCPSCCRRHRRAWKWNGSCHCARAARERETHTHRQHEDISNTHASRRHKNTQTHVSLGTMSRYTCLQGQVYKHKIHTHAGTLSLAVLLKLLVVLASLAGASMPRPMVDAVTDEESLILLCGAVKG